MKKTIVPMLLVVILTMMSVVPVFARDVDADTNITGWNEAEVNVNGDYTLTVDEGGSATVGHLVGEHHTVTITGGGTLNVDASAGDEQAAITAANINIDNVTVNATGSESNDWSQAIQAFDTGDPDAGNINITNATVNATGQGYGIYGMGAVTITNSTVNAQGPNAEGIGAEGGVTINNSDVTAQGLVAIQGDVTLINASVVSGSYAGQSVVISKEGVVIPGAGCGDEEEVAAVVRNDSSASAPFVVAPIAGFTFTGGTLGVDTGIRMEEPGPIAEAAFAAAMPKGYTKGFAFSITNSGQNTFNLKQGRISFKIPAQYLKSGRKFKLLGIDKDGNVKIFDNAATEEGSFAADIALEGFSFELVYAD